MKGHWQHRMENSLRKTYPRLEPQVFAEAGVTRHAGLQHRPENALHMQFDALTAHIHWVLSTSDVCHQIWRTLDGNCLLRKMRNVGPFCTHDLLLHDVDLLDKQHILLQHGRVQVRVSALPAGLANTTQHHVLRRICLMGLEKCVTYGKAPNTALS